MLASATYTLDAVGNRKTRVDQAGTHTYTYDALHRLTGADYPGTDNDTYTYDKVGNRLTKNSLDYTYNAADRMTDVEGTSYGYDNNGNQASRGASDTFSWDAEDRLTSATVSSTTTTFAYNGDGLRESRTTGGNTTTFSWDLASSIPEILDDGTFRYIYGLGRIAEVGPSTTTHYYLPDGLGSTMAITNSSGSAVNTYDYDVFGAIRASTSSQANEFKFTGEQVDSNTGLQYLRARYYDQAIGRFMGQDALFGTVGLPLSQNRYAYVLDNPVNLSDPSGLCVFGVPCPKQVKKVANAVGDYIEGRPRAIRDQFTRDMAEIKAIIGRFATRSCLAFALDAGALVAITFGGPLAIPIAAGLFAASMALDAKEGDIAGMGLDAAAEILAPLSFIPNEAT